jgi:hypothetical protein
VTLAGLGPNNSLRYFWGPLFDPWSEKKMTEAAGGYHVLRAVDLRRFQRPGVHRGCG